MTKTQEFILDADTGQYLNDEGKTVAEAVGSGEIKDVSYVGDTERVEFVPEEKVDEKEEYQGEEVDVEALYSETANGDYTCDICGDKTQTERGIKSHIAQKH